jgi:hypothetical protein
MDFSMFLEPCAFATPSFDSLADDQDFEGNPFELAYAECQIDTPFVHDFEEEAVPSVPAVCIADLYNSTHSRPLSISELKDFFLKSKSVALETEGFQSELQTAESSTESDFSLGLISPRYSISSNTSGQTENSQQRQRQKIAIEER